MFPPAGWRPRGASPRCWRGTCRGGCGSSVPDVVDEPDRLVQRVEDVELEPVHDLLGQQDTCRARVLRDPSDVVDAALPLVLGRPATGEHAEGNLVGAGQDGGTDGGAAVHHGLHVLEGAGSNGRIVADGVELGRDDVVRRALEAQVVEPARPGRPLRAVEIEHRDLDTVIPEPLHQLEGRHDAVVHVVGPQHQVESVLHLTTSDWCPARSQWRLTMPRAEAAR